MRARTLLLLFLAVLLAGGTALLARTWLAAERSKELAEATPLTLQTPARSVLVARADIRRGQILRPEDSVWQVWPEGGLDTVSITDLNVVLGRINPDYFLGGDIALDPERARREVERQVAEPLGLDVERAAAGVIELFEQTLRNEAVGRILGKGYSPADYTLLCYGGGGPLHVAGYTDGVAYRDVIVPAWAAGFSAYGCACADFEYRSLRGERPQVLCLVAQDLISGRQIHSPFPVNRARPSESWISGRQSCATRRSFSPQRNMLVSGATPNTFTFFRANSVAFTWTIVSAPGTTTKEYAPATFSLSSSA